MKDSNETIHKHQTNTEKNTNGFTSQYLKLLQKYDVVNTAEIMLQQNKVFFVSKHPTAGALKYSDIFQKRKKGKNLQLILFWVNWGFRRISLFFKEHLLPTASMHLL